tara:strand:+ start:87 stop:227 length:141 start_codon:yes stop_codon:yes gene_type:complete
MESKSLMAHMTTAPTKGKTERQRNGALTQKEENSVLNRSPQPQDIT